MTETNWAVTKKKGITELRAKFSATGHRFAQVLIRVSADGVEPTDDFWKRVDDDGTHPQVVISMNGTAGMSIEDYREMVNQIDVAIEQSIKQMVGEALS